MEDIITFIILVVVGGISIISKIVSSRKSTSGNSSDLPRSLEELLGIKLIKPPMPVMKPPVKPKPGHVQKTASSPLIKQKKSLIPEEEPEPEPARLQQHEQTTNENSISTGEISGSITESEKPAFSELIRSNAGFAILCHEILGKPKSLRD